MLLVMARKRAYPMVLQKASMKVLMMDSMMDQRMKLLMASQKVPLMEMLLTVARACEAEYRAGDTLSVARTEGEVNKAASTPPCAIRAVRPPEGGPTGERAGRRSLDPKRLRDEAKPQPPPDPEGSERGC